MNQNKWKRKSHEYLPCVSCTKTYTYFSSASMIRCVYDENRRAFEEEMASTFTNTQLSSECKTNS